MVEDQALVAPFHETGVVGDEQRAVVHLDKAGPQAPREDLAGQAGGHRVKALAHAHPGLGVGPELGQVAGGVEGHSRQGEQVRGLGGKALAHGHRPGPDAPGVVGAVAGPAGLVQLIEAGPPGHGHQVGAPETSYFAFDAALFVGPFLPGDAKEAVEAVVGTQRYEALGLVAVAAF